MQQKYLLYIDILGFANLSLKNDNSIRKIYETINELNVHRHGAFETIVFSDTILVTNRHEIINQESHEYLVMFSCEFVQDLLFKCQVKNLSVPFRAILSYGEFEYYELANLSCYHGKALVDSYNREKSINGVGLFISNDILKYNKIFRTIKYDKELDFVFLTQRIASYYDFFKGETLIPRSLIEDGEEYLGLPTEIDIIKSYYLESTRNEDPKIRSKYLQTYSFFKREFPELMDNLESVNFDYKIINAEVDWDEQRWT